MAVDREAIREYKLAYMAMFDQIAHPDGSNYPRLRKYVWSVLESQFSDADKQRQTQALSALCYTLMITALLCAAAEELDEAEDGQVGLGLQRFDKASWCLGLIYAIGLTHPDAVQVETGLALLGEDELRDLFAVAVPSSDDGLFWGEFRVLGHALYQRMFRLVVWHPDEPKPLMHAVGVGFGVCPSLEVMIRSRLVRALLLAKFAPC